MTRRYAVAVTLGLLACDSPEEIDVDCSRAPPLTYETFGKGFVDLHCVGCHSSLLRPELRNDAPPGVDLDTYEGVLTWSARIRARSLGAAPTMPPGGGPTEEELTLLDEWLGCELDADLQRWEEAP